MNAADQLREEGRVEGERLGRLEGLRHGIMIVLSVRDIPLSAADQARIASCTDPDTLLRWVARALTAPPPPDLFADTE